jgi:hypothetical protein
VIALCFVVVLGLVSPSGAVLPVSLLPLSLSHSHQQIIVGANLFAMAENGDYDYSYSSHFDTKATNA